MPVAVDLPGRARAPGQPAEQPGPVGGAGVLERQAEHQELLVSGQPAARGAGDRCPVAGLQVLGNSFTGSDGRQQSGLGIVDCSTRPKGERQIGELVVEPTAFDLPLLTGFENHGGITELGPQAAPLGRVKVGYGNGVGGVEGVVSGRVIGTYLHGPALARNPALADLLLSWVVGPLDPLDEPLVDRLRSERLSVALGARAGRE